jgi:hypothetical protein
MEQYNNTKVQKDAHGNDKHVETNGISPSCLPTHLLNKKEVCIIVCKTKNGH